MSDMQRAEITASVEMVCTFGLTWVQLCRCWERPLYAGASGRECGLLTAPSFPPLEPAHRKRAGCGNGLQHTNTPLFILVLFGLLLQLVIFTTSE